MGRDRGQGEGVQHRGDEGVVAIREEARRPTSTLSAPKTVQRHEDLKSIEHPTETFNIEAMKEWMVKKD